MTLPADSKLAVFRHATELLAASRDFDETMANTIAAFLPVLGDFGFFDLVVGDGVRRTSRAHEDPRVGDILRPTQWIRSERTDMNLCALSTGRPGIHPDIDDTWYRTIAVNDGHLAVLRDLGFVSMITVPMRYQGELLGALTLFHGRSGRRFGEDDLAFGLDLAALAAPVVANARLLDQQRRTNDALRASEERLRVGMDAGGLGIWDWDIRNDVVTWSDRVYALHGVTREQFGGRVADFVALIHPDDREGVGRAIARALADGSNYAVELRVPQRDGSVRWLYTRAEVTCDASGAPVRMVGATYDVTERRALLERAARARSDAEAASRAKDDFLAMLGHELRNPLAPIASALHVMEARDPTAFRHEREVIGRQVRHLGRLVDDLLDVARIASGKIGIVAGKVEIGELVATAVEAARPQLAQLTVEVHAPAEPVWIDGDADRLAQAFGNLIGNAAKFSRPGQRVDVTITPTDTDVEVAVADQGAGIDPELLPRIFEMFVQGPQPLARKTGGLGLGLAIVSNLVALHGGRVTAESPGVGQGATFRVTLPRAVGSTPRVTVRSAIPAAALPSALVVDDNVDAGSLLGELLALHGCDARVATSAREALDELGRRPADVAILDIGLPEIDGYALAREVRGRLGPRPVLIALTGYGLPSDRERALAAGFDAHLTKPVDVSLLLAKIGELWARRG